MKQLTRPEGTDLERWYVAQRPGVVFGDLTQTWYVWRPYEKLTGSVGSWISAYAAHRWIARQIHLGNQKLLNAVYALGNDVTLSPDSYGGPEGHDSQADETPEVGSTCGVCGSERFHQNWCNA